jgi:SAM-dependent methyltransferase
MMSELVGDEKPDAHQAEVNARLWSSGRYLSDYAHSALQPAEALILARYREALTGRVLDVGCGAGRILAYLVSLDADAVGMDIGSRMVEHCRRRFPGVDIRLGDLGDLPATVEGPFDSVLLSDNVIDVFDDDQRRRVLRDVRDLLGPGGLLVFSAHNLASREGGLVPARPIGTGSRVIGLIRKVTDREISWLVRRLLSTPRRMLNRRRLARLQYRGSDHAVVNDDAHDFGLLHYYIGSVAQERQLSELGYQLIEVREFSGPIVPRGEEGQGGSLYYVAIVAS